MTSDFVFFLVLYSPFVLQVQLITIDVNSLNREGVLYFLNNSYITKFCTHVDRNISNHIWCKVYPPFCLYKRQIYGTNLILLSRRPTHNFTNRGLSGSLRVITFDWTPKNFLQKWINGSIESTTNDTTVNVTS